MTPIDRGRALARAVLADILPRISRGDGPVDLERLAERVAEAIEEDRRERPEPTLFDWMEEGR